MHNVGALILAAGGSTRLGHPKQLLEWDGESLVRRIARAVREGGCTRVAVVVGPGEAGIATELQNTSAEVVPHPEWARGLGSSIKRGVQYYVESAPPPAALVLLACDQPFVDAFLIASLLQRWEETYAEIVASRYADTIGIPALFDYSCFEDLLALPDASGAKRLLEDGRRTVAEIPFAKGAIDIDTVADLDRARGKES